MTSFAHAEYPAQHPGVIRAEQAVETFRKVAADLSSPKGVLAALIAPLNLLASTLAAQIQRRLKTWRMARQDARMWELAQHDHRLMAELQSLRD